MNINTRIAASTGGWFDLASNRIGLSMPSDMFVGFGERTMLPLATTSFNGVRYQFGVVSSMGERLDLSSEVVERYREKLRTLKTWGPRGYNSFIVPLHVRSSDLESDAAVRRCIATATHVVELHRRDHPEYRGVATFIPATEAGFQYTGLSSHYDTKRMFDLCRAFADLNIVAAFIPKMPDSDLLNHREAEEVFLNTILTKILDEVPTLRVIVQQVQTITGAEWVVKHAYDGTTDGLPRVIASLSPAHMIVPFDVRSQELTDFDRWMCFDAEAIRYHAFAYPGVFCLGSGMGPFTNSGLSTRDTFRTPVLMHTLLEQAFDVFRLPSLPTTTSSIGPTDRKRCEESCISRIEALERFAAITGPSFVGLTPDASQEKLVFEVLNGPPEERVEGLVPFWRSDAVLQWRSVLKAADS